MINWKIEFMKMLVHENRTFSSLKKETRQSFEWISIWRMDAMKFYDRRYSLDLVKKLIVHTSREQKNNKNFQ